MMTGGDDDLITQLLKALGIGGTGGGVIYVLARILRSSWRRDQESTRDTTKTGEVLESQKQLFTNLQEENRKLRDQLDEANKRERDALDRERQSLDRERKALHDAKEARAAEIRAQQEGAFIVEQLSTSEHENRILKETITQVATIALPAATETAGVSVVEAKDA